MTQTQNKIPKGWKLTRLGNQIKVGRGSSPRPIQNFLSCHGIPWVKIADASASETRYILKTKECIKEEGRSTSVRVGDLIVSNSATPGIPKFMGIDACVHDGWLVFNDYKELNKLYLYYFFLDYRKTLEHSASGTVFVNLQTEIVRNIEILLPPLPEQKAIAGVLSSLDDKIELLREENRTLEEMAQALFKRWFVEFEFPDANGRPYRSTGGRMIKSELGEIPEGWRVGRLKDFGNIICGKTPSKSIKKYFNGDILFIKIPDMHNQIFIIETEDSLTKIGADSQTNKYIPEDSICVSCIATVGLVSMTIKTSQTNQQINSIIPSEDYFREYLYLSCKNMYKYLNALGTSGSATLNINTKSFSNIVTLVPDKKILKEYSQITKPMFNKMKNNLLEIQSLSRFRDTLLPKLMRGEIRIK